MLVFFEIIPVHSEGDIRSCESHFKWIVFLIQKVSVIKTSGKLALSKSNSISVNKLKLTTWKVFRKVKNIETFRNGRNRFELMGKIWRMQSTLRLLTDYFFGKSFPQNFLILF